jgi:hypothetical protein
MRMVLVLLVNKQKPRKVEKFQVGEMLIVAIILIPTPTPVNESYYYFDMKMVLVPHYSAMDGYLANNDCYYFDLGNMTYPNGSLPDYF